MALSSQSFSLVEARGISLAAQGFLEKPSKGKVTRKHLKKVLTQTQLLQIDSVSVAVRAHYAPVFSRLGGYDRGLLDVAVWSHSLKQPRLLTEYWVHEAAMIPIEDWPLLRWRMEQFAEGHKSWTARVLAQHKVLANDVVAVLAEYGPLSAGEIEVQLELASASQKGAWWNRSDTKVVAEALFAVGTLGTAFRSNFARKYDLIERIVPKEIGAVQIDTDDAIRQLIRNAAQAQGIATEPDLRDYYRLSAVQSKKAIRELVDSGELTVCQVQDWQTPAYMLSTATSVCPDYTELDLAALLCPFDPLIFFRPRTERLFNFHYRLEIYTPEPKRKYGYYVWPFLLNGELVARVDIKADRAAGVLRVPGAFIEPGQVSARVAQALATSLVQMAAWLELDRVELGARGDLIKPLQRLGSAHLRV
ncbi:MAG: winged helix-turn-helix domain-containing protein [Mycobacteriaceae bacterium]